MKMAVVRFSDGDDCGRERKPKAHRSWEGSSSPGALPAVVVEAPIKREER